MHLVAQVCRSLAEAHAMGIVHRDVKPANVYLCRMGLEYDFVKVLDFGLVRHEDRSVGPTALTAAPVTMGTPAYMAPEVILGEGEVDRRADVYAIGCVAYFLLTGERVFDGATPMKVMMQHVHEVPTPPSQRTESPIPCAIDDVVVACLHKDPARRPRDASALLAMVEGVAIREVWNQRAAQEWWHAHLPHLATPVAA
jgi:serine/threonine-protein kinase